MGDAIFYFLECVAISKKATRDYDRTSEIKENKTKRRKSPCLSSDSTKTNLWPW